MSRHFLGCVSPLFPEDEAHIFFLSAGFQDQRDDASLRDTTAAPAEPLWHDFAEFWTGPKSRLNMEKQKVFGKRYFYSFSFLFFFAPKTKESKAG